MSLEKTGRALQVLDAKPGKWFCVECWSEAAGLTSPEDQGQVRALARRLAAVRELSGDYENQEDGVCDQDACGRKGLVIRARGRG